MLCMLHKILFSNRAILHALISQKASTSMKLTITYTIVAAAFSATSANNNLIACRQRCASGGRTRGDVLRCAIDNCPPNSGGSENKSKLRGSFKSNQAESHSETFDQPSYKSAAKEKSLLENADPYTFCTSQCYQAYGRYAARDASYKTSYLSCLNLCSDPYGVSGNDDYFYDDDYYYSSSSS